MASEWSESSWGDLATLEYGKGLRGYEYASGPYRVFGTNGPIGWHSQPLYDHPTVVVGRKGAYRGIHFSSAPCFVIDTAFYLSPKTDFDMRWAYYELLTKDINAMDSGSAIPSTSRDEFYHLPVKVPPLAEQKAIAHILGALDDKIELNRQMNATLEAMARALFKSWFLDFDPVRAKAERRAPGLPIGIANLFPAEFQDSGLGAIPKGWCVTTIAELSEINSWTLGKDDQLDRIEYVEISEVVRGNVGTIQVFERGNEPSRARRQLRHGDTVLSTVRPERGSYFLCLNPSPNLVASTGFAVVTPTKAPWSYIHAALTQPDIFDHLGQQADGGAYPAVRPDVIVKWQVPCPDKASVLEAFHRICAPLYERADQNRRESRTLAAIRDVLLPKLLSGEVRIEDAERFLKERGL